MLDLQAGVHLDEIELAVLVEELDGAGAAVAELAHGLGDTRADGLALGRVECRRQRLLQHLLVTALQRAVALAEVDRATLAVGRSEEHTSELQSLMRISYAVFCLKKKNEQQKYRVLSVS